MLYKVDCPWCGRFMYNSENEDDVFDPKLMCDDCKRKFKEIKQPDIAEINREYINAPICPHCGDRKGFSWGTGDCGCQSDPE